MEFVLSTPSKGALGAAGRLPLTPSKPSAPTASTAADTGEQDRAATEEASLRAQYARALALHAENRLPEARSAYDGILAALGRSALSSALSSSASKQLRDPLDALAARIRDPFAENVAGVRVRMRLREVTRKNRARVEEEMVDAATATLTATATAATNEDQRHSDQLMAVDDTPPSSPAAPPTASLAVALDFYLAALTASAAAQEFEAKIARLLREEDAAATPTAAAAAAAAGTIQPATTAEVVQDVDLWQRIARVAGKLRKYTVQRRALEQAFRLRPTLLSVVDPMLDLLHTLGDVFLLHALVTHVLTQVDPWSVRANLLQHRLGLMGVPDGDWRDTEEFFALEARLRDDLDPSEVARVQAEWTRMAREYAQEAATCFPPANPPVSPSPVDLTQS